MIYRSKYGKAELIRRWDEITSPARFAGANEQTDWTFISKRNGDRITLVRKPAKAYDPLASVFRGRIVVDGEGSAIKGVYTKSPADYVIAFIIFTIYFSVCFQYYLRADEKTPAVLLIAAGIAAAALALSTLPSAKKKYGALILEVTGGEAGGAKTTGKDEKTEDGEEAEVDKKKYKFRF